MSGMPSTVVATLSGRASRGHAAANDMPTTEPNPGSHAAVSGEIPEQIEFSVQTDENERGRYGRRVATKDISPGIVSPEAGKNNAVMARRVRETSETSLDAGIRNVSEIYDTSNRNEVLKETQLFVTETKDILYSLMNRLDNLEKALGLNDNHDRYTTRQGPDNGLVRNRGFNPQNTGNADSPGKEIDPKAQRAIRNVSLRAETDANGFENKNSVNNLLTEQEIWYLEAKEHLQREQSLRRTESVKTRGISSTPMSRDVEDLIAQASRQRVVYTEAETVRSSIRLTPDNLLGQFFHKPRTGDARLSAHQFGKSDTIGNKTSINRYKPLEPTTPDKYNGDADFMTFHKYITQCERFCEEAALPPRDRVVKCADYLTGKAYKFYTLFISLSTDHWDTERFFKELYNYCFPPDYRLRQRKKLDEFSQGDLTVAEYAAELTILFRIIGRSTAEQRVDKLWNGLRPEIQSALWKEGLDYESCSWEVVIEAASRHELAERIQSSEMDDQECDSDSNEYYSDHEILSDGDTSSALNSDHGPESDHDDQSLDEENSIRSYSESKEATYGSTNRTADDQDFDFHSRKRCYRCNELGHIRRNCPYAKSFRYNNRLPDADQQDEIDAYCMHVEMMCCVFENEPETLEAGNTYFQAVETLQLSKNEGMINHGPLNEDWMAKLSSSPLCDIISHELEAKIFDPENPQYGDDCGDNIHLVIADSVTGDSDCEYDNPDGENTKYIVDVSAQRSEKSGQIASAAGQIAAERAVVVAYGNPSNLSPKKLFAGEDLEGGKEEHHVPADTKSFLGSHFDKIHAGNRFHCEYLDRHHAELAGERPLRAGKRMTRKGLQKL